LRKRQELEKSATAHFSTLPLGSNPQQQMAELPAVRERRAAESRQDRPGHLTAISPGHGIEATAERLMEESSKAHENGERYALMRAENAAAPVGLQERSRAYQARSLILTSQLPAARWHDQIGDPTVADGILDRLVHNAYRIEMRGDSMRKNRGKQPNP
jgi:hypothetical protein